MRTLYKVLLGFIPLLLATAGFAQTTITTVGAMYDGQNNCGNGGNSCYITFVVNNTNTTGIIITEVSNYTTSANSGNTATLLSSTTSLSGPPGTLPNAAFTQVASGTVGTITTTGINPVLTNLNILVPPSTQVRFLLHISGVMSYSGNATVGAAQPNTFTASGVSLHNGDYAISGQAVGHAGVNTPRSFTGAITFVPAVPCTSPPVAGTTTTSATPVCSGASVQIGLNGNSQGLGQTYQLLTAPTAGGPYTTVGAAQGGSTFSINPTSTAFYRIRVVCGTGVDTSAPVQVTVPTLFPGGTYTINNSQPTAGSNFNSFTDAVNAIACGIAGPVIFNVANNATAYNEQINIPHINTTSSTNTVTFNGNNATLQHGGSTSLPAVVTLNGADWIRIKRLNIVGLNTANTGVQMINDANNNMVDSCTIALDSNSINSTHAGISVSGSLTSPSTSGNCDSITLTNNTIIGGYFGLTIMGGATAATASNANVISNNVLKNFYIYGIYTGYISNTLIERNDLSRPTRNVYSTFYGIYTFSTTGVGSGIKISRNRIHDPAGTQPNASLTLYGIYHSSADGTAAAPHEVSNNMLYNLRFDGAIYALYNSGSDHVKYWHNTVSADDALATTTGLTRGFYQLTAATGIELKNNIFSLTRGGTGTKHGAYWGTAIAATNPYSARNNVYHITNPGSSGGVGYRNSTNYPTLAAYQTASLQDTGSVATDPVFASPVNNNFAPNASAVNNIGVPLPQVPIDIFGTTRSTTTPDPGAIEFTPVACTTPPAPGAAIASDTTICAGMMVNFDAPGTSFGTGQTFQWQTSPTLAGTYTNVGTASALTPYSQVVNSTAYFRVASTCGTSTVTSSPVRVQVVGTMAGGTYTINAGAPASATNFQSFSAAIDAMQCGITGPVVLNVVAGSGPYTEQVIFPPTISGTSSTNTITVNGNNNTINFNTAAQNINGLSRAGILLNGVDWVRINNLTVDVISGGAYGFGIHLYNDADNNIITGCTVNIDSTVTSSSFAGVVVSGSLIGATSTGAAQCDSNRFLNNTVLGGYYGMTCVGNSTAVPNYNNLFRGNTVRNFYVYGIYGYYTNGWTIDSNYVSRPTRPVILTFYGVALSTASVGTMVSRNRVFNTAGGSLSTAYTAYPLYASSADGSTALPNMWVNNMVYDINGSATIYGIYNSSSDNNLYRHNTISLDDPAYTGTGSTYGFYQVTSASGIDIRNNIFSLRRTGASPKTALYFSTAATTFTSNYNDLHVSGGTGTNQIGYYNSLGYATLATWQAIGKDTASVDVDPQFTNALAGSLTPTNQSLDNIGQPLGVAVDAFGAARSLTTPDIGAIEWSFIPPCAVPTALTDVAAATTATLSWTSSTSTNVGYEYVVSTSSAMPTGAGTNVPTSPISAPGPLTPGTTYYWFVRTVCGPGSYSAWVMDSFTTCVPPASTLIAQGSPTPNAVSICQGDTAMLKAPGGAGNTYLFLLNGATAGSGASADSTFHAMQAGSYTVVVTNATGCYDTSDAVQVTVNPLPTPNITQTSYNQLTTTTTFTSYQWNLAGAPISGATSQTYTAPPTGNGTYTVTVTDANGCRATSSPYNLTTASVAAAAGAVAHIRIFPNPTTGRIFIESSEEVRAGVWTLDGRRLMEVEKAKMVDLSNLASGVYMLRLTDANGTVLATERVTKTN